MDDSAVARTVGRKLIHLLRVMAMYLCLAVCVLLSALWFKSYNSYLGIYGGESEVLKLALASRSGQVSALLVEDEIWTISDWGYDFGYDDSMIQLRNRVDTTDGWLGLVVRRTKLGALKLVAPHWACTLAAAMSTILLKPSPRFRFRLGGLLITISVVAVVVATVEWLLKSH